MATISDIQTTEWQISTQGVGLIVQGTEDVRQCINTILLTRKGSDPLRPEFGCDIYQYIDKPVNRSIPQMIKSILEAIAMWEPRVKVISIKHEFDFGT